MNNKIKELKTYFFKYSFPHLLLYRVGESCFYIFIIYLLGFLNSVPLLKNLPTDKLARIADCLEVVGITRTLNFCANQRSYEIVFTISRLSRLYITIVCLSFKRLFE